VSHLLYGIFKGLKGSKRPKMAKNGLFWGIPLNMPKWPKMVKKGPKRVQK